MMPLISATFDDSASEDSEFNEYNYSSGQISGYSSPGDVLNTYEDVAFPESPGLVMSDNDDPHHLYSPDHLVSSQSSHNDSAEFQFETFDNEPPEPPTERRIEPGEQLVDMIRNMESTNESELVHSVSQILMHALEQARNNRK
jgi:hypothetical protein